MVNTNNIIISPLIEIIILCLLNSIVRFSILGYYQKRIKKVCPGDVIELSTLVRLYIEQEFTGRATMNIMSYSFAVKALFNKPYIESDVVTYNIYCYIMQLQATMRSYRERHQAMACYFTLFHVACSLPIANKALPLKLSPLL